MNNWRNWALAILGPIVITLFSAMAFDNGTARTLVVAIVCMLLHVYLGTSWITRKVAWIAYFACWIIIAGPMVHIVKSKHNSAFPMTKAFSVRFWKALDLRQARLVNAPMVEMDQRIEDQLKNEEQHLAMRSYSSASHMARARKEFDEYRARVMQDMETKASEKKKEAASTSASAVPAPVAQPVTQVTTAPANRAAEPDRNNIRVISETTATPIPAGKGQTTPCWYKADVNGKLRYWADNHKFTMVTADGRRYYFWDKVSMEAFTADTLNVPYYLINESDQAVNATAKIRLT